MRKATLSKTKSLPRKSTHKRSVPVRAAAPPEESFWVHYGPILHSFDDLKKALKEISDEQVAYHTKRAGNDFAKWVDEVLHHSACAKALVKAKTRAGMIKALSSCKD